MRQARRRPREGLTVPGHLASVDPASRLRRGRRESNCRTFAAAVTVEDNVVVEAAIGVTGATARAFAASAATAFLIGKSLSSRNIEQAASIVSEHAEYLSDRYASAEYRKHLVKTEVGRALSSLRVA